MSNHMLTQEQIEKLLAVKKMPIRETTVEDVQLIRQNIADLIEHHRKLGMEEAIKKNIFLQENLDETTISVDDETEQQIFYSFQYPKIHTDSYTLQDSCFMIINKN